MHINCGKDNIFIIDDIFTDDECEKIIRIIDKFSVKDREVYKEGYNVYADSVNTIELPSENQHIIDMIIERSVIVCKILEKEANINIERITTPTMRKIKGKTLCHIDGVFGEYVRNSSFIISLNSDYEGGELHFPIQGRYIKLKRGQALAFPPYWTHPHCTTELKNDTFRYTLNFWGQQSTSKIPTN